MPSPSDDPISAAPRVQGLDTLRALAIVWVFAYHYQVFVSGESTFGWVGVDLFFVLSGYLIANQLFAEAALRGGISMRRFYARRLLRTLPNYWVVLALYFALPEVMGGKPPPSIWAFLTFTQNVLLQPGTAFSHAWSLWIEEQFYLLLPAVTVLGMHRLRSGRVTWNVLGVTLAAAVAVAMAAAILVRSLLWLRFGREADGAIQGYHPNIYYTTWCRADEFLPGLALAALKNFHPPVWRRLLAHGRSTFIAGLACTGLMLFCLSRFYVIEGYGYGYWMTGWGYTLLAGSFAVLVLSAVSPASPLHRVRVPGAATLAAWSYAIYLTHKPVAHVALGWLQRQGIEPASGTAIATITFACLTCGGLLHRLIETPFMNLRDRLLPAAAASLSPTPLVAPTGPVIPRSTP